MNPLFTKLLQAHEAITKTVTLTYAKPYSCGDETAKKILALYLSANSVQQVKQAYPTINIQTLRRIWKDHAHLLGQMSAADMMTNNYIVSKGLKRGRKQVLTNKKLVAFHVEAAANDKLKALAKRLGKTKVSLFRKALDQILAMYED